LDLKWSTKFELKPGRWVFVPSKESVELGDEIRRAVQVRWRHPDYFFHLRAGGHVAALKCHLLHAHFLHLDIQNFFGSINRSRVTRCLKPLVGYRLAREWAIESTVKDPADPKKNFLPYGFVQSQLLASLCLHQSALGQCLSGLQRSDSFGISVYVDDLIISSNEADLKTVTERIKGAATRSAFTFNSEKEQGPGREIQAFNVRLAQESLALTDARLERFLLALQEPEVSEERRQAIVSYIRSINDSQANSI
jgi:hypothetical protein